MERIKIDKETADLIVSIYQKISLIKGFLSNEPYSELKEFIESSLVLNEAMNGTMKETTKQGMESKLVLLSAHLKKLSSLSGTLVDILKESEIPGLFGQLQKDISHLQSKINATK